MLRTCGRVSGFTRHRASHFLVSPQLVARLVKRGYPSMQTPVISRRRQSGQHLPSYFVFSEYEELLCCWRNCLIYWTSIWKLEIRSGNRLNRSKNLNKFAWHLRTFGTYSVYSHRLLGEMNTAVHLWHYTKQEHQYSYNNDYPLFIAFLMKHTSFASQLAIE